MFKRLRNKFKKEPKNKEPYTLKGIYDLLYLIYPNSALDDHIVKHGIIQDWIATRLGEFIKEDGIILDIGANVGLLTLPFAKKHVPKGKVFAFEPDMENYTQLEKNIQLNSLSNVFPYCIALQDNPLIKEVNFYLRRAIDGDKLTNRGLSTLEKMSNHNISNDVVSCSTIDQIVNENELSQIDFIKIDVEGSEFKVLTGGINTIKKHKPVIMYEYSIVIDKLTNSENTFNSFQLLKNFGYVQYKIFEEKSLLKLSSYDPNLESANIIAFPESNIPNKLKLYIKN
jgi:FkbM family methyltransferase